jgi:hypothetical protein
LGDLRDAMRADPAREQSARGAEIARLVEDFHSGAIERTRWTHEAHLIVATWHALRFDPDEALARVRVGIQRLNAANGVAQTRTGGYHETLTCLYMTLVSQAVARMDARRPLAEIADGVIAACGDRRLPLRFYSEATLMSWAARTSFVDPDVRAIVLPEAVL